MDVLEALSGKEARAVNEVGETVDMGYQRVRLALFHLMANGMVERMGKVLTFNGVRARSVEAWGLTYRGRVMVKAWHS